MNSLKDYIENLALNCLLPARCFILSDGVHIPHYFYTLRELKQGIPEGFPLWLNFKRGSVETPCILRVKGDDVSYLKNGQDVIDMLAEKAITDAFLSAS